MRALRMSNRSVYHGLRCLHCHKRIAVGRAFLGTTLYVSPGYQWVRTQSLKEQYMRLGIWSEANEVNEVRIRVVYHRACVEAVLRRGPNDPEIEVAEWEAYRAGLLERFGIDDDE